MRSSRTCWNTKYKVYLLPVIIGLSLRDSPKAALFQHRTSSNVKASIYIPSTIYTSLHLPNQCLHISFLTKRLEYQLRINTSHHNTTQNNSTTTYATIYNIDLTTDLTRLPPRESTLDGRWTRKPFGLSRVQPTCLSIPRPS